MIISKDKTEIFLDDLYTLVRYDISFDKLI